MPSRDIPDEFRNRPFPVAEARAAGMSRRMLRGTRFRAVTRGVYATAPVPESYATLVRATLLTLPVATIATGYEGDQHRTDRGQWNRDIDRHEDFARDHWTLIRVTSERLRWPRQVVRSVFDALRSAGYDGPEPTFDQAWSNLFERPDRRVWRPGSS